MRKIGLFLMILTLAGCTDKAQEQKFVNPIFYKVMEPVSTGTWQTQITPTEMLRNNKGATVKQSCTLIENKMESVTLRCEGPDPENRDYIILYRFTPDKSIKDYKGLFVWMYEKGLYEKKFISHDSLIIHNNQ